MKKGKSIVLIISLVLNVVMFAYAVTQNLEAQRNLVMAQDQQEIALQAKIEAEQQRALAEKQAELAHRAMAEAEAQRQRAEEQLSKK